ncbi:MAG: hypothetical protein PHO79_07100 [Desulfoplanes sp.]|nr:hypothetical protein [Desulfoplanes sp.]MDD4649764.1 hypothetical protein [Desulfoplanes sp.]
MENKPPDEADTRSGGTHANRNGDKFDKQIDTGEDTMLELLHPVGRILLI